MKNLRNKLLITAIVIFVGLSIWPAFRVKKATVSTEAQPVTEKVTATESQPQSEQQTVAKQEAVTPAASNLPIVVVENGASAVFVETTERLPDPPSPMEIRARKLARQAAQAANTKK